MHSQQLGQGVQIKITTETRSYGKKVTVVSGVPPEQISEIAKELKTRCAAGGTIKNGRIEIQGEHNRKVKAILEEKGYKVL